MASPRSPDRTPGARWPRLTELIAEHLGLHFPSERLADLQRGVAEAAVDWGFEDVAACADWLLSVPVTDAHLQVLASHLTTGETYFFREKKTFEVLASRVLPELIHARRDREQRLRLWSAGCCSGEEAYSLAILLRQVLPDLADWHVTILATDINALFLRKAVAGSYAEWSFRDAPTGFKERHFIRTEDGRYAILPEIQQLVTFEQMNLVSDRHPSLSIDTTAMDLIFCRNVLMYFTPAQTRKVIGTLHRSLVDGGWLAVSPSEASQALFPQFVTANFPGVILYQKSDSNRPSRNTTSAPRLRAVEGEAQELVALAPAMVVPRTPPSTAVRPLEAAPTSALEKLPPGSYGNAVDSWGSAAGRTQGPQAYSWLARAMANQGRLAEARVWCDRWIAADKVDAVGHYLRAVVLLELGREDEARRSLQRALYLDPSFVLAHFTLGSLARHRDHHDEADKHFANTLRLLGRLQPHALLAESDGLTAGRLAETIAAMAAQGPTR